MKVAINSYVVIENDADMGEQRMYTGWCKRQDTGKKFIFITILFVVSASNDP